MLKQDLKYIATTSDNYANAWQKLEERFDNKRAFITNTLRKLFNQHHSEENASQIRELLDTSRECISALQSQGINTDSWDCILIFIISKCVPSTSLNLWEQSLPRNQLPTIENLLNFLDGRFRTLEFIPQQSLSHQNRPRPKPQAFHSTTSTCRVCNGPNHPLPTCPKFLAMQPNQRLDHISQVKLCRNCFAFSHNTSSCKSSGKCYTCGERHHTLLHLTASAQSISAPSPSHSNPFSKNIVAHTPTTQSVPSSSQTTSAHISRPYQSAQDESLLATALLTITAFDGKKHTFRSLLDNCSQDNFVHTVYGYQTRTHINYSWRYRTIPSSQAARKSKL